MVADTAELLRSSISRSASLRFDNSAVSLPAKMVAAQIQQILMNLVNNASECLDGGQGSISVTVGRMQVDQGDIDQLEFGRQLKLGEHAFIEVTDSGIGTDKRTKVHLVDPFFTNKFTGRGLGLAIRSGSSTQTYRF